MTARDIDALRKHGSDYSPQLFKALAEVSSDLGREIFFVGGTVRDWFM